MYSPTTRLLTVLALLQAHHRVTGAEIARRLEVDARTVRRYITMLQDMGVPVEAERGSGGAYFLGRGSKMPPLMFTDAEAVALTLGLLAMRAYRFPVDPTAVEGVLAKTERVLPETLLAQVRGLQEAIVFDIAPPQTSPNDTLVAALSTAVYQRQRVHLRYRAWDQQESARDFDPYGIVYLEGYWYTAGYCHLREALRTFRLDRITALQPVAQSFTPPPDFDALAYVYQSIATVPGDHPIRILLKATLEEVQQALPPVLGTFEVADDGVILTVSPPHLDWLAYTLLMLSFPVVVLESEALRQRMRDIAQRALHIADA